MRALHRGADGILAVHDAGIERHVLVAGGVVLLDRVHQHLRRQPDLRSQFGDGVGLKPFGADISALAEQLESRIVVNLMRETTGLRKHRAAGLGVGVRVLGFAFVVEAFAARVAGNAEFVFVAIGGVAVTARTQRNLAIREFGADRSGMGALPVASRTRPKRDEHIEYLAGIVPTTAQTHEIAIRAKIARPHLRACLKATGAADDRTAKQVVFAVWRQHSHAVYVVLVTVEAVDLGLVADLDAHAVGDLAPPQQLTETAADRVDDGTRLEKILALHRHRLLVLEPDAYLMHPAHGFV